MHKTDKSSALVTFSQYIELEEHLLFGSQLRSCSASRSQSLNDEIDKRAAKLGRGILHALKL